MRGLPEVRTWAATRYRGSHRAWLAREDLGAGVALEYGLHPPSEQQVGQDPAAAAAWWVSTTSSWVVPGNSETSVLLHMSNLNSRIG